MATQPILKSGHCWRVGNGNSINALKDRWIPNYLANKILHLVHENLDEMLVSNLINLELHVWRNEEIMFTFHREEAEAICKIPLSRRNVNDAIIWLHISKGTFTVKLAYHVARKLQTDGNWAGTSRGCARKNIWAAIWNLRLPNKIKVFEWRACHDILPTSENLIRMKVVHENKRPICTRESKSTIHALWGCAAALDIWAGSIRTLQKGRHGQSDMMQLMEDLLE